MTVRKLFPHQQQLLDQLVGDSPPTLLIRSPVGAGLTEVLVQLAARRSQAGDFVVVVVPSALADQWIYRLREAGTESVRALRKTSELLLVLDSVEEPELPRSGVVIVTAGLLGRIAGNRVLDNVSADLVIVSDLTASEHSRQAVAVMRLIRRANQAIVTVHTSEQARWFTATETVEWTLDMLSDSVRATRSVRVLTYAPSQQELADQYHAATLLAEVGGQQPAPPCTPAFCGLRRVLPVIRWTPSKKVTLSWSLHRVLHGPTSRRTYGRPPRRLRCWIMMVASTWPLS
jgi:hypothetical protein